MDIPTHLFPTWFATCFIIPRIGTGWCGSDRSGDLSFQSGEQRRARGRAVAKTDQPENRGISWNLRGHSTQFVSDLLWNTLEYYGFKQLEPFCVLVFEVLTVQKKWCSWFLVTCCMILLFLSQRLGFSKAPTDPSDLIHCLCNIYDLIQCEAPKIAKLVYNSNNYGLWYL